MLRKLFATTAAIAMMSSIGFAQSDVAETAEAKPSFSVFVDEFRTAAMAAGISAETYDREMSTVGYVALVKKRNNNQPEFSRPIWSYIEGAVSERRVTDGKANMAKQAEALLPVAQKYNVDPSLIAAIWGLESAYGAIQGDFDILSVLSTLAFEGRRQRYGRQQLLGALEILDKGYATRDQLKGSWAGAMGQTQFIPTTYLSYAIDENEDGRRDLWADHQDVFASTANYLSVSGYEAGTPWGFEVTLPYGFDYADAHLRVSKPVALWASKGVMPISGTLGDNADLNASASIILPAGANGPAFMVFKNFRAIMKYNNSTAYSLGVAMLSDTLAEKKTALKNDWPRDDRPLSRTERETLQQALADKGFNPGPVDGIIGAGTKAALRKWQDSVGIPADGYASAKTLEKMLAE